MAQSTQRAITPKKIELDATDASLWVDPLLPNLLASDGRGERISGEEGEDTHATHSHGPSRPNVYGL